MGCSVQQLDCLIYCDGGEEGHWRFAAGPATAEAVWTAHVLQSQGQMHVVPHVAQGNWR